MRVAVEYSDVEYLMGEGSGYIVEELALIDTAFFQCVKIVHLTVGGEAVGKGGHCQRCVDRCVVYALIDALIDALTGSERGNSKRSSIIMCWFVKSKEERRGGEGGREEDGKLCTRMSIPVVW